MGCVHSRVEKEETVRRSRERRRLMKQLLSCRADLAAAYMAYLRSLRNTGATLRQFTDVESLIPGKPPQGHALPPSPPPPPPPLPPSPPPPPHFSPLVRRNKEIEEELRGGDSVDGDDSDDDDDDDDDNDSCKPPPPPGNGPRWEFWDPLGPPSSSNSSSPVKEKEGGVEEEDWAETNTEFGEADEEEEEEGAGGVENVVLDMVRKSLRRELVDDNSSAMSLVTKDTDTAVVAWRSKKTLAGIVKEIDDYFLKAAAGGNEVMVLLEPDQGQRLSLNSEEIKEKKSKSAKVFNAFSWSWSFKSFQSNRDACGQEASDVCRPSHCATLEKIYAEEQRLYKEVKEEELVKFLLKKKTLILHKLEARDHHAKMEDMRSSIENLQSRVLSLQESINGTCLSISKLRDEELHPQLVELTFRLMQMWRAMYECHQVQSHIAQQANLIDSHPGSEPTTESHCLATAQLETEVTSWYTSFCNLIRSQNDYVHVLNQWVRLTDCIPDNNDLTGTSGIHALCEEWQLALDRLPYKVAAEAIKSFVSVIHSIVMQQNEEHNLQKKSSRLESRLEKELISFSNLEEKHKQNEVGSPARFPSPNHHISSMNHGKLEALKKKVEEEKAKYLNSVRISRAMTLNNLQTGLPNIFQAIMGFAGVCVQALDDITRPTAVTATAEHQGSISPL